MRRTATLIATTGLAVSCLGAMATSASAAAAPAPELASAQGTSTVSATEAAISAKALKTGKFSTKNAKAKAWLQIKAYGNWWKNTQQVKVAFTLADYKKDGYTACVQFNFYEGKNKQWQRYWIKARTSTGKTYNFDGKAKITTGKYPISSTLTTHATVQECGISKKTGKWAWGPHTKLY